MINVTPPPPPENTAIYQEAPSSFTARQSLANEIFNFLQEAGSVSAAVGKRKDEAEENKERISALRKPEQGGYCGGASEMTLVMQIQKLEDMKRDLTDFCIMMQNYMDEAHKKVQGLKAQGFPKEKCDDYEKKYLHPAKEIVDQMINRTTSIHYSYLDGVIIHLQNALYR